MGRPRKIRTEEDVELENNYDDLEVDTVVVPGPGSGLKEMEEQEKAKKELEAENAAEVEETEQVEEAEAVPEPTPEPVDSESKKEEEVKEEDVAVSVNASIDPAVQQLLRIFNSYDELYITKVGGVFPKNGKPSHVKDAVLYKNPFFKKVN